MGEIEHSYILQKSDFLDASRDSCRVTCVSFLVRRRYPYTTK